MNQEKQTSVTAVKKPINFSAVLVAATLAAIVFTASSPAHASIVYDFKKSGGASGGGTVDLGVFSSHLFVEVTDNLVTPANDVMFKFTNELTEPQASIVDLFFDTGDYTSLFTALSVTETFGQVNFVPLTPENHVFLPKNFSVDYKIGVGAYPYSNSIYGINPGEYAVVTGTLSVGSTVDDVISAMNLGLDSATETTGLRVGVLARSLLGGSNQDAGYVTNSVVAVPEAESWAMILTGLGLLGLTRQRRDT